MADADRLFGTFQPTGAWIERVPVWLKYAGFLAITLPAFIGRQWWLTAALLVLVGVLGWTARLGARRAWALPRGLIALLVVLGVFQGFTVSWLDGCVLVANLVLAVWASRLVVATTPVAVLLDALATLARPVRLVGADPQRFALAVAIMVRSVPYLMGAFATVRQAARARGVERRIFGQLTQVIVAAVAYGQATGDALDARGL